MESNVLNKNSQSLLYKTFWAIMKKDNKIFCENSNSTKKNWQRGNFFGQKF